MHQYFVDYHTIQLQRVKETELQSLFCHPMSFVHHQMVVMCDQRYKNENSLNSDKILILFCNLLH